MLRSSIRVALPLVQRQPARGMATLGDAGASLKKLTQSVNMASVAKYASELAPPTPAEIPKAIRDMRGLLKGWQNWTVREAWLNALVTTEVVCWFFVGECIGKGTLIGYQV
jgi:hypothetical protein